MDVTTIARDVLDSLTAEGAELPIDLSQAEVLVRDWVTRIGARVLELHLADRKLGYEGCRRPCSCGDVQRFVGYRSKTVATLLGPVHFERAYYRCAACGASGRPYDQQVGLGAGQVSVALAKAATLLAIHEPFELATEGLYELTGQRLSKRTVARLTHRVGTVASQQESQQAGRMASWQTPPAEASPRRLYGATDGTMVHEQGGWHEVKAASFYWDDENGQRHVRYRVRFAPAEQFTAFVWSLACRCGLEQAAEKVLLGDGAKWIWDHIGGLLKDATHIVDWYHAVEHVWACGRALHGEGHPATQAWVKEIETLLWKGQVQTILTRLREEHARARAPTKREALQALATYVENQGGRLAYDRFRAQGLEIGSGQVEAACKHVVGVRMKRNGMRWSRPGAQATLSLRAARLNSDWHQVWSLHPLARAA
jgi:hypothetical protein